MNRRLLIAAVGFLTLGIAFANSPPNLNRVVYGVSESSWVPSMTATVTVSVNATVKDNNIGSKQQLIIKQLGGLAKNATWHITDVRHNENASGLEQLSLQAQSIVPTATANNLRARLKKLNQTGVKYQLDNIDFHPSDAAVARAREKLRVKIYQQVASELKSLNSVYPDQHYTAHAITIVNGNEPAQKTNTAMLQLQRAGDSNANISNKQMMHAIVVLAANRKDK